jgi:hypothetical protein
MLPRIRKPTPYVAFTPNARNPEKPEKIKKSCHRQFRDVKAFPNSTPGWFTSQKPPEQGVKC